MAARIGALWVKKKKDGDVYMTGEIDLGFIFGKRQIVAWKNRDKKKENQPDYVINISEPKEKREDAGPVDIAPATIGSDEIDDQAGFI